MSRQAIAGRRASHQRGELADADYAQQMRAEIAHAVNRQEALGLDVLVHGEAERKDMVDYFGEQLDGFIFTRLDWATRAFRIAVIPPAHLRVSPDCGLKTRDWAETEAALKKMVAAAQQMRAAA